MATAYQYDGAGRLWIKSEGTATACSATATVSNARSVTYKYDPYTNQKTEENWNDGFLKTYVYLANGLPDTVTVKKNGLLQHSRHYEYNPATWRVSAVVASEGRVSYEYTDAGQVSLIQTDSGQESHYSYDALGRLTDVWGNRLQVSGAGAGSNRVTYSYHPVTGQRAQIAYSNGTTVNFTYDARGGVYTITHKNASNVELLKLTYNRDWMGRIATQTEVRKNDAATTSTTHTWTYSYDHANRLKIAVLTGTDSAIYSYTYDSAGNRRTKTIDGSTTTYNYNSLNQLISDGTYTYEYDVYGNLKKKKEGATVKVEYFWSGENRLISAVLDTGPTAYFTYDDAGTRVEKKSETSGVSSLTRYLTDYQNPTGYSQTLSEFDPADPAGATEYVYADGSGPLAQFSSASSALNLFHTDHLGSTRLLTDSTGSAKSTAGLDYAPYGEPLPGSSPSSLTPYAFTGQFRDTDLSLQYHRARWLNTGTANWLSSDPVFDLAGNLANAYSYVRGDPLARLDPSGSEGLISETASLAIQCYTAIDNYMSVKDLLSMAATVVSGGSVSAIEVTFVMISLLPGVPSLKNVKWLKKGGQRITKEVEELALYSKALKDSGHVTSGQAGEWILKKQAERAGLKRAAGYELAESKHIFANGFDDVFKMEDGTIVIGEAKGNFKRTVNGIQKSARDGHNLPEGLKETLGGGPFEQGSKGWVLDCAHEMANNNNPLGKEIIEQMGANKVLWYEVHTELGEGNVVRRISELVRGF